MPAYCPQIRQTRRECWAERCCDRYDSSDDFVTSISLHRTAEARGLHWAHLLVVPFFQDMLLLRGAEELHLADRLIRVSAHEFEQPPIVARHLCDAPVVK